MSVSFKIAAAATALLVGSFVVPAADAAEHEVKMLNKSANGVMQFEPPMLRIAPGDKVRFVPTDKGHNAETIDGMLPEGAAPFAGKLNEELTVTFDKPGIYGLRCKPHYAMGMVGLIVVGDAANEDAAKAVSHPGGAKKTFAKLFEQLDTKKSAALK